MRRTFSILAVAALMAVAAGAAATLGVQGGAIQSGGDDILTCDGSGVTIDWGVESDESPNGDVYFLTVGDISETCFGNELFVNVTDGSGNILTGEASPVAIDATSEVVHLDAPQDAQAIEDVHVIIGGPNGS